MKVIGIQQKVGSYQGVAYDNIYLHCTYKDSNAFGELTELVKIKSSLVSEAFGHNMTSSDWHELIGKEINSYCNKYGNVIHVEVIQPNNTQK